MQISEIVKALDGFAPHKWAESYDNVGLLVGEAEKECAGVLVGLEVTDAVIDEALAHTYNLIVTHHPIWFGGKKRLIGVDYSSRTIMRALRENVALYAIHTNLDAAGYGVNRKIAEKIGLLDYKILSPQKGTIENIGSGGIGRLPEPLSKSDFLARLRSALHTPCIRYADAANVDKISTVAFCGGAGAFLIPDALAAGAQAFVTGDVTYHKFFDGEEKMLIIDAGHYETEQYTPEILVEFLRENFVNIAVHTSEVVTNPVRYYVG